MNKIEIEQKDIKQRLDVFLVNYFENKYPRAKICSAIEKGLFLINEKIQKTSHKLKQNDIITFKEKELNSFMNPDLSLKPWNFELDILFEDEDLIVLNKPKNMLCHPTKFERENTLSNALLYHTKGVLSDCGGLDRLGIVHRLDKNTSGIMLAAKNNGAHENLSKQIKEKSAIRKYFAIALVNFEEKKGIINKPLLHSLKDDVKMIVSEEGLEAITHFEVIEEYKGASLVELNLKTGRTHQIRAHLSSIGHPVFGDSLYGAKSFMRNEFYNLKTQEQLLQSYYLSFEHPKTKEKMEFQLEENKFSEDFIKVLNFLRSKYKYEY
ncbi:MAG: RluA family pseudouridine synthase [Candidatus Gastranaerophilales bacterium]|nr:RluA family pseudouridine synthase [Candidatus Gastranaerophilales bacterium]